MNIRRKVSNNKFIFPRYNIDLPQIEEYFCTKWYNFEYHG